MVRLFAGPGLLAPRVICQDAFPLPVISSLPIVRVPARSCVVVALPLPVVSKVAVSPTASGSVPAQPAEVTFWELQLPLPVVQRASVACASVGMKRLAVPTATPNTIDFRIDVSPLAP